MKSLDKFVKGNRETLSGSFCVSAAFIFTGLLLRLYEYVTVSANFVLPAGSGLTYFSAFFYDILFLSGWAVLFYVLFFLMSYAGKKWATGVTGALIIIFFLLYIPLIQYYYEVLTPLGSDFFAYDFTEVSDTVYTSIDITFSRILPFFLFPVLFIGLFFLAGRVECKSKIIVSFSAAILVLSTTYLLFYPTTDQFESELDYTITVNKAGYFIRGSYLHFFSREQVFIYDGEEYPFTREADTEDVLGQFFEPGERPPSIVFVIVEGLGGTLMEPHASYGGFTPFLDSLANNGLYWTHFLATSGRSFNAQPSIFGSLPFGENGFMEMGYQAPDHHTLISILNDNGYQTNYFAGYDTRFDKLDVFLENQGIDLLINSSRFPDEYSTMDAIEGGFTWGYSDKDTYRRAFDFIDQFDFETPRLDIFFSLNFHEPFIIQESEYYKELFHSRLEKLEMPAAKKVEFRQYEEIFAALLYTDAAIEELIERYRKRADFDNTIFVVTGDHRMIPIPHRDRIDRYYVPFIIYSPMIKEYRQFNGVSSHFDVTPTLLSYLSENYGISTPDQIHWLGGELSTSTEFEAKKQFPFMRTKNQMPDYLSGEYYLSGSQLFRLYEGMEVGTINDRWEKERITEEFQRFKAMNLYVTSENKLISISDERLAERRQIEIEEKYLIEKGLDKYSNEELFWAARDLAFGGDYKDPIIILNRVLRQSPNFHDARLLYGRIHAWDGDYDKAEDHFDEVIRRNPGLMEAYSAKADIYFWQGNPEESVKIIDRGLERDSNNLSLIFRKARAYNQKGDSDQVRVWAERGLTIDSSHEELLQLLNRL
jgi:lipoteichoic acid synthase